MNDGIKWCGFPSDEVFWLAVVGGVQMFPVIMKDAGRKAKREKWGKEKMNMRDEWKRKQEEQRRKR